MLIQNSTLAKLIFTGFLGVTLTGVTSEVAFTGVSVTFVTLSSVVDSDFLGDFLTFSGLFTELFEVNM